MLLNLRMKCPRLLPFHRGFFITTSITITSFSVIFFSFVFPSFFTFIKHNTVCLFYSCYFLNFRFLFCFVLILFCFDFCFVYICCYCSYLPKEFGTQHGGFVYILRLQNFCLQILRCLIQFFLEQWSRLQN